MFYQYKIYIRTLRIAIIGGTGSVGAYFAKQLVSAGHCVSIIGRVNSRNLRQIQMKGLTLITSDGKLNIPATEFNYIGDLNHFPNTETQDLVIICLKQFDMSAEIAKKVSEITNGNSLIGIVSNGLPFYFMRGLNFTKKYLDTIDSGGQITQLLNDRQIMGIQPVIASKVVSPGLVHIIRPLTTITVTLGFPENFSSRKIEELQELFNKANIKTTVTVTGLRKNILEKLQFALSINTLSAILEKNIGNIFDSEETQILIIYSIKLINQIALRLDLGTLRSYEQFKLITVTKEHFSSLYHDIKEGKPGEVKAIVDATIELVQFLENNNRHEVPMPDVKPLEILRHLLNQKAKNIEVNTLQLTKLFEACHVSLDLFAKDLFANREPKLKIRSKL